MDVTVSFITAIFLPWTLGGLVHSYDILMVLVSLVCIILAILITYISPIFFYSKCIREASYFETNFRLSLKQMYDGDRLSKKETSILPKTYSVESKDFDSGLTSIAETTEATSMMIKMPNTGPK